MKAARRSAVPRSALVLALGVLASAPAAGQQRGDLNAAVELERQGRHAEAAERFMRVLAGDPGNLHALFGLERTLHAAGSLDRILPFLAAAQVRLPREAAVRALELRVLAALGRHDEIAPAAERWIADFPASPDPYRDWAFLAAGRGDLQAARRILERGRARLGASALVQELAQLDVVAGAWVAAARHWHAAARLSEALASAAALSLGQVPPAERDAVLRALLTELGDSAARRIAADLLVGWNRPGEAWALLDANPPGDPRYAAAAYRRFADRARLLGTPDAQRVRAYALERLARLERGATAQQVRIEAARAFADAGDRAGAARLLDQIARDPSVAPPAAGDAMTVLIAVIADAGRAEEAEQRLAEWEERIPAEARASLRERVAWAWMRREELERAERVLGDDSTVTTAAVRGWLALFRGDLEAAVERFREAGPYAGTRAEATRRTGVLALLQQLAASHLPSLGQAFVRLERGDTAGGITRLEQTARALPADGGRGGVLGFAGQLAAEGRDPRAESLLREAIGTDPLGPAVPAAELALAELAWRDGRGADALARLEHLILTYPESAVIPQARRLMDRIRGAVPNS